MEYRICLFLFYLFVIGDVCAVVNKLECVLAGSDLRKECDSDSTAVSWYLGTSLFQMSSLLEIDNFTESDSNVYVCAHANTNEVFSNYTLIAFEPIRLHSPLSYTVVLTETADILCDVTGRPELTFSWFRDNIRLNVPPNTNNIYIPSVSPEDIGTYECQVTNECQDLTFSISVSSMVINSTYQLSQGAIIGIVVAVILCLFITILCGFVACIQVRKYFRTVIRGSKSGSSRGSIYSDQSKLRQKKSIIHSSSHRNSITDLFVQDGIIHDNPVFTEGIANEKGRAFSNLIGIPQLVEPDRTSHLSLAGSTTGGKHYSSDDLELKPIEKLVPTPEIKRSKSLRSSRVEKKEFLTEVSYEKPAPYEHRFSPKVSHINPSNVPELTPSRGMRISDTIAETRKIFDNPELDSTPPKFRAQFDVELKTNLVPIADRQRKISLDDGLSVTPGDVSDYLILGAKAESDSSEEDELVSALPIKMPHFSATRHSQEESTALKEFQRPKRDVSFDELDKHFHVLDTFVSPATFLSDAHQKRVSSAAGTKSKNLESILEESPSMVRMAEWSSAPRLGARRAPSAQQKVLRSSDEGDPWKTGELANIPKRIVATRSMRFDPDY